MFNLKKWALPGGGISVPHVVDILNMKKAGMVGMI
jgi:hypothetical protein